MPASIIAGTIKSQPNRRDTIGDIREKNCKEAKHTQNTNFIIES